MFVYNLKVNKKFFLKVFKLIIVLLCILLFCLTIYSIFKQPSNLQKPESNIQNSINIDSSNYTYFLKDCHENISKYENIDVTITGYVYRLPDFSPSQFVLARTMLINETNQAVVVGILCECENAKEYGNYEWITITGTVFKGNYKGEIPEINVKKVQKTQVPLDEFVFEPID